MSATQVTQDFQILIAQPPGKPTHDELRDRWLDTQPPTAFGLGDYRQYDAGLWQVVPTLEIKASISEVIEAAKTEGIKPTADVVSSVAELAKFKVAKRDSVWDSNSDYLVCRNGTLHVPTRILSKHNPELYTTSGVFYDYDPSAKAPAWDAFLFDLATSTSQTVVDFLQEFAGYALTTDTRFELSIWLYGPPGSGKSTFLIGLEAMLESRAGLLGLADIASNRFALANLPGKTLVISTEQPGDYIASTHVLNKIISGETIKVERKFRDPIDVTPRCKLAWAMNELPRVSDPNSGLFRRVKVIEFPAIPEMQRDPTLKEAIKTEAAGILNWALVGLDRLQKRGRFEIPQEVLDATQNFKASNDIPARFVEECCLTGTSEYKTQATQLYNAYKTWCIENGHRPQTSTKIADDWKRLGFEKHRPGGINYWYYVALRPV
jgi:putative DNA primase/helicase